MAEVKSYKVKTLPSNPTPNSIYWVKASLNSEVSGYITDLQGVPYPLKDLNGIVGLTNTDGNLVITGTNNKVINLSTSLLTAINSALQSGDNISELVNDAGYITLADIPSSITNLSYTASPTNGVINSDTGTDATIPLADLTNAGLLSSAEKSKIETAIQPSDLSLVATSNDYNDLNNIPTEFTPSVHTHVEADITDLDKYTQQEVDDNFLSSNLSTYPTATLPISDTDQLFVIQDGEVKKVDKSEIGGGGTSSVRFYNATNSSAVTSTTSLVLVQTPVLIPAGTFKTGDCATFRARLRRTVPTNANTSLYLYISTLPTSATPVGQQMNYVIANLTNTLAQGKSEWVVKNQNNLTEIVNYTNNDDDIIGNDYRNRTIDWDVDQYIYIWIGNTNTATSSYFSFWELLKH